MSGVCIKKQYANDLSNSCIGLGKSLMSLHFETSTLSI